MGQSAWLGFGAGIIVAALVSATWAIGLHGGRLAAAMHAVVAMLAALAAVGMLVVLVVRP